MNFIGFVNRGLRCAAFVSSVVLASCNETTQPALRYPLLDDVGQSNWQTVSVGGDHTCGLKTDGSAWCWGSNRFGQLGIARNDTICGTKPNTYGCSITPQRVQTNAKFSAISAGQRHTCGITVDGDAYCWGANDASQLGNFAPSGPTLWRLQGGLPWTQISAGATHSCAVRSDGALFCWGQSDRGQIGNGGLVNVNLPTRVQLADPVASVSAGQSRTCARTTVGRVYCWGAVWVDREDGLEITRSQTTPELVPTAPSMSLVSVGSFTTCGADMSGFAYCWEANPRGEMGDGTFDGSQTPKRVATDLEFVQIAAGIVQTCGITINGTGYCWGDDSFGQLGALFSNVGERCANGTLLCSSRPLQITGRQQFMEISTGFGSHACGVSSKHNLYCWGLGVSGQRGDGLMTTAAFTPATVAEPKQ